MARRVVIIAMMGFCGLCSALSAQVQSDDAPTTMMVGFQSKKGYQLDLWVDGRRWGYVVPGNIELSAGVHFVSAGHPDTVPVLSRINVEQRPQNRQIILLDSDLLTGDNFEAAFAKVLQAYRKHPANEHIIILAATMTRDHKDFQNLLQRIPRQYHSHSSILLAKARWAIKLDELQEAEQILNDVTERIPSLATAWQLKARLLINQDNFDKAIRTANRAIALESNNPWNFITRGDAYMLSGEVYNAQLDYERALELDPGNKRAIIGLEEAIGGDK